MLSFVMFAALMLALALAFVLRPLLTRHAPDDPAALARRRMQALVEAHAAGVLSDTEFAAKRTELGDRLLTAIDTAPPRSRATFVAATAVALLLPALAIVLYRVVGSPAALDPAALVAAPATAPAEHGQDMEQAIGKLAAKLKQNPGDVEGWALLGRAYLETQRFAEAREALKHAHDLAADDPDVGVAYAEALTLAGESHQFDAQARALIEAALKADPKNQRGIWLLGIADYQAGKFDVAIADWNRLLTQLPKDSTIAQSVRSQIARAEAARDGKPLPAETTVAENAAGGQTAQAEAPQAAPAAAAGTAAADGARLTVKVTLDPNLTAQVSPADTVFVYAKAASGLPMPLAIQRLRADQLPATVVLTDSMGMLPSMKLSQFPQIIIGARISKSGNALAQAGDLQTVSKPLDVKTTAPIALTIDQTVP
jgi:cytochrome c-type biogenesis protein CcmH